MVMMKEGSSQAKDYSQEELSVPWRSSGIRQNGKTKNCANKAETLLFLNKAALPQDQGVQVCACEVEGRHGQRCLAIPHQCITLVQTLQLHLDFSNSQSPIKKWKQNAEPPSLGKREGDSGKEWWLEVAGQRALTKLSYLPLGALLLLFLPLPPYRPWKSGREGDHHFCFMLLTQIWA